jgi:hypothetical protein
MQTVKEMPKDREAWAACWPVEFATLQFKRKYPDAPVEIYHDEGGPFYFLLPLDWRGIEHEAQHDDLSN